MGKNTLTAYEREVDMMSPEGQAFDLACPATWHRYLKYSAAGLRGFREAVKDSFPPPPTGSSPEERQHMRDWQRAYTELVAFAEDILYAGGFTALRTSAAAMQLYAEMQDVAQEIEDYYGEDDADEDGEWNDTSTHYYDSEHGVVRWYDQENHGGEGWLAYDDYNEEEEDECMYEVLGQRGPPPPPLPPPVRSAGDGRHPSGANHADPSVYRLVMQLTEDVKKLSDQVTQLTELVRAQGLQPAASQPPLQATAPQGQTPSNTTQPPQQHQQQHQQQQPASLPTQAVAKPNSNWKRRK
ncbi:hypothetical protein NESM_000875300 [Novymonas esmeraldas]|uniref:Uncharacterized protein n=1 Tax=Novymonas esmeraldas TaxID=1808958 RepID=A0AAW0EYV4_9TRYP